jgi:hypothetical protein
MDNICLPKTHLLLIFIFVIILVVIYKNMTNQKNGTFNDKILNKLIKKINQIENDKIINETNNEINNDIKIKKVYYDDFHPPEQINRHVRNVNIDMDRNINIPINRSINIPTRGFPEDYQLKGLLLRDNTETAYNLFGRQKFPGSSQYEYYIIANMDRNHVKIPLKINGDKEIEDGQTINVPGTNQNNGSFTVKLYDYDVPRYIPY